MRKIFCDKCNKEIWGPPNFISIYKQHMVPYEYLGDYHLCDDCRHRLRSWLLNENVKPGSSSSN